MYTHNNEKEMGLRTINYQKCRPEAGRQCYEFVCFFCFILHRHSTTLSLKFCTQNRIYQISLQFCEITDEMFVVARK